MSFNLNCDVCVACLSEKAPKLPLREELICLGIEVICHAKGTAEEAAARNARQVLSEHRKKQQQQLLLLAHPTSVSSLYTADDQLSSSYDDSYSTLEDKERQQLERDILANAHCAVSYPDYLTELKRQETYEEKRRERVRQQLEERQRQQEEKRQQQEEQRLGPDPFINQIISCACEDSSMLSDVWEEAAAATFLCGSTDAVNGFWKWVTTTTPQQQQPAPSTPPPLYTKSPPTPIITKHNNNNNNIPNLEWKSTTTHDDDHNDNGSLASKTQEVTLSPFSNQGDLQSPHQEEKQDLDDSSLLSRPQLHQEDEQDVGRSRLEAFLIQRQNTLSSSLLMHHYRSPSEDLDGETTLPPMYNDGASPPLRVFRVTQTNDNTTARPASPISFPSGGGDTWLHRSKSTFSSNNSWKETTIIANTPPPIRERKQQQHDNKIKNRRQRHESMADIDFDENDYVKNIYILPPNDHDMEDNNNNEDYQDNIYILPQSSSDKTPPPPTNDDDDDDDNKVLLLPKWSLRDTLSSMASASSVSSPFFPWIESASVSTALLDLFEQSLPSSHAGDDSFAQDDETLGATDNNKTTTTSDDLDTVKEEEEEAITSDEDITANCFHEKEEHDGDIRGDSFIEIDENVVEIMDKIQEAADSLSISDDGDLDAPAVEEEASHQDVAVKNVLLYFNNNVVNEKDDNGLKGDRNVPEDKNVPVDRNVTENNNAQDNNDLFAAAASSSSSLVAPIILPPVHKEKEASQERPNQSNNGTLVDTEKVQETRFPSLQEEQPRSFGTPKHPTNTFAGAKGHDDDDDHHPTERVLCSTSHKEQQVDDIESPQQPTNNETAVKSQITPVDVTSVTVSERDEQEQEKDLARTSPRHVQVAIQRGNSARVLEKHDSIEIKINDSSEWIVIQKQDIRRMRRRQQPSSHDDDGNYETSRAVSLLFWILFAYGNLFSVALQILMPRPRLSAHAENDQDDNDNDNKNDNDNNNNKKNEMN